MQSSDQYFAQQTMNLLPNYKPWIVHLVAIPYVRYGLSRLGLFCFEVTAYLKLCKGSYSYL